MGDSTHPRAGTLVSTYVHRADAGTAVAPRPFLLADGKCLAEENGNVLVRDDLDALLQVRDVLCSTTALYRAIQRTCQRPRAAIRTCPCSCVCR